MPHTYNICHTHTIYTPYTFVLLKTTKADCTLVVSIVVVLRAVFVARCRTCRLSNDVDNRHNNSKCTVNYQYCLHTDISNEFSVKLAGKKLAGKSC